MANRGESLSMERKRRRTPSQTINLITPRVIRFLMDSHTFREASNKFRISKSEVCKIVQRNLSGDQKEILGEIQKEIQRRSLVDYFETFGHPATGRIPWNKGKKKIDQYSMETKKKVCMMYYLSNYTVSSLVKLCGLQKSFHIYGILRQFGFSPRERGWNCFQQAKISNAERLFKEILGLLNLRYDPQKVVEGFSHPFDFCLSDYGILVEIDGDYWHGNPRVYSELNAVQKRKKERDEVVNKFVRSSKYCLLRFWDSDLYNNPKKVMGVLEDSMKQSDLNRNVEK